MPHELARVTERRPSNTPPVVVGADPGSSDKGWATWQGEARTDAELRFRLYAPERLDELVAFVVDRAVGAPVLLSLDAPICVPGGLLAPSGFTPPPGVEKASRAWPFDVNPFSQRPCEKALSSVPKLVDRSLSHTMLCSEVSKLASWTSPFKANQAFADRHPGLSVLGYMSAPHAPIVRTFLARLRSAAETNDIDIDFNPVRAANPRERTIYVLESHPALTLAIWCVRGMPGFPSVLPKYKGGAERRVVARELSVLVSRLLVDRYDVTFATMPDSDDALDALVGASNVLDLARGRAEIFGTEKIGYFLVPAETIAGPLTSAWQQSFRAMTEGSNASVETLS